MFSFIQVLIHSLLSIHVLSTWEEKGPAKLSSHNDIVKPTGSFLKPLIVFQANHFYCPGVIGVASHMLLLGGGCHHGCHPCCDGRPAYAVDARTPVISFRH
jgi:hypothetical protein